MKMKLGVYLKETREKLNLTLREVEESTGISNAYLSQLENNKIANPSPTILHKLADHYNVSYLQLLELTGYPIPEIPNGNKHEAVVSSRIGNDFPNINKEEEGKLLEYLSFLRSRKQKK